MSLQRAIVLTRILRCIRGCRYLATAAPNKQKTDYVRIVEVGPRDGLQNEKQSIPLETKIELIEKLTATGLRTIEAGSFVSPKWVPQMANSSEILSHILDSPPSSPNSVTYQFLLPNVRGLENFLNIRNKYSYLLEQFHSAPTDESPVSSASSQDSDATLSSARGKPRNLNNSIEISIFTAATESFSMKNMNCSIAESISRFKPLLELAKKNDLRVRAYVSVALGCPYEGPDVNPLKVASIATTLLEMGAEEISIGDTTGMGTAPKMAELLRTLSAAGIRNEDIALHLHDTFGQALVNAAVGLEHGIRTFDTAIAGLGGCPFSPGATGNVSTEDLVYMFESLGARTDTDIYKLARIGDWISKKLNRANESRAGKATLAKYTGT